MECLAKPGKMDHLNRVHFNVSCYWPDRPGRSIMAQVPKPLSEGGLKSLSVSPRPLPPPPPKLFFEEAGLFEPVICDFSGFGQCPPSWVPHTPAGANPPGAPDWGGEHPCSGGAGEQMLPAWRSTKRTL